MDPTVEQEPVVEGLPAEESTPVEATDEVTEPTEPTPTYKVKVQGEELEVTLEELQAGYSRHSDYTRKAQALAEQRAQLSQLEALAAALERDPQGTLKALEDAYGLNQGAVEALDPEEARIAELERFVAEQQEAARQATFDRQVESLKQRFGDVDEAALLEHAIKRGIPDLEAAYADMNFQKFYEASKAAEQKQKEVDTRTDAKRQAQVVAGGGNRQAGSTSAGDGNSRPSFAEAIEMAKQQLGF